MIKKILLASLLVSGLVSTPVPAKEELNTPDNLSKEDKLYGLSLFWKEASHNFAFFDQVPNLNFDNTYRKFIPKVLATETTYEYYRELMKFNALLTVIVSMRFFFSFYDCPRVLPKKVMFL